MDWIRLAVGRDEWWGLASEEELCSMELVLAGWEWLQKCENMLLQGASLERSGIQVGAISIYFILLTALCIGYIHYFLCCSFSSSKVSILCI